MKSLAARITLLAAGLRQTLRTALSDISPTLRDRGRHALNIDTSKLNELVCLAISSVKRSHAKAYSSSSSWLRSVISSTARFGTSNGNDAFLVT